MNNRGAILVFSLFVVLILSVLLASFYFGSINENQLANRYADSTRALWLAEAGIAEVKSKAGIGLASNFIDDTRYTYNAVPNQLGTTNYYNVVSTGTVTSLDGKRKVKREVNATMKLIAPSAANFLYGVETTSNDLDYKTKCIVNTENPANIAKTGSTQTFENLFGISKAEMKAKSQDQGTYLSGDFGNTINGSGVTWVDVEPPGALLNIEHLQGDGIVIINGNFKVNGVPSDGFDGILYVIGQLETLGNSAVNGTVFVESSAAIGADLSGSSLISYDSIKISNALLNLATKSIVSWKEG
jgi:hypothetical protein